MQRLVRNKGGEVSYGPKWHYTESSSDSENDNSNNDNNNDLHSLEDKKVEVTVKDGELMYLAALHGDWVAAELLLNRDPNLAFEYVTEEGDRALHVAASMKHKEFADKLVGRMSEEQLALLDGYGNTACCYAALSGDIKIARLIIGNRPNLVTARDEENATPLRKAALRGNSGMLSFLLGYVKDEDLSREEWFDLLLVAIHGKMFGVAVDIMGKNVSIATMASEEEGTALHLLARVDAPSMMSVTSLLFESLKHLPFVEDVVVGERSDFHRLAKKLWGEMLKMEKASLVELLKKPVHIVHEAAKTGQVKIITMLSRSFPALIRMADRNGYTIFHLAVMYRQTAVFGLVHQAKPMLGLRIIWQDGQGNNILHLAAKAATVTQLKLPPAYQMQDELEWFQAVKKIVPPSCLTTKNRKGLMPGELFSKTHKKLLKESRTWMLNKADSSMLIATILLTVVFAAAFTVPGAYSSKTGEPVLAKKIWFKRFVDYEIISIMFSVFSIMIFHSIMSSSFQKEEFLHKLPILLAIGFECLLFSLLGALFAFVASISLYNISAMSDLVWYGMVVCAYGAMFWAFPELYNALRGLNKMITGLSKHALFKKNVNM